MLRSYAVYVYISASDENILGGARPGQATQHSPSVGYVGENPI